MKKMNNNYRLFTFAGIGLGTLSLTSLSASAAAILGLYTFEGTGPTAYNDVSGQGLNPTTIGAGVLSGAGYQGQAASFDGSQNPIVLPLDIDPTSNSTITIGAWVRPATVGQHGVFGQDNGGWDRGLAAGGNSADNWKYPGGSEVNSGIAVTANTWQFVAVAYNGTTSAKFYVDTNSDVTTPHPAGDGRANMSIGALSETGVWRFNGLIDNFFIFDDVLTDAEIETIRTGGVAGIQNVAGIPEPSSGLLICLGGLAVAGRRRRS